MTETEGIQILGELLKASHQAKQALQFHDIVLNENRRGRKPSEKAARLRRKRAAEKTAAYGYRKPNPKWGRKGVKPTKGVKPATHKPSYSKAAAAVLLIGPGGDLRKLATSSSVPRDISQVGTDQRPPVVQEKANPVSSGKRTTPTKNPLKVVL